jgi:hypothetical protein
VLKRQKSILQKEKIKINRKKKVRTWKKSPTHERAFVPEPFAGAQALQHFKKKKKKKKK